jgi:hypothetical protein
MKDDVPKNDPPIEVPKPDDAPKPPPADPPTPPQPARDDLTKMVESLAVTVDQLATQVAALVPSQRDEAPTSRPWTHWGRS